MPIDVLVEEVTTLPEGAKISVSRCQSVGDKRRIVFTQLRAYHGKNEVTMRVDDVGPSNVRTYLELCIRAILRLRANMETKPVFGMTYDEVQARLRPKTIQEFVLAMADRDMFIFINDQMKSLHDNPTTNTPVESSNGKASKQHIEQDHKPTASGTKRSARRNRKAAAGDGG